MINRFPLVFLVVMGVLWGPSSIRRAEAANGEQSAPSHSEELSHEVEMLRLELSQALAGLQELRALIGDPKTILRDGNSVRLGVGNVKCLTFQAADSMAHVPDCEYGVTSVWQLQRANDNSSHR